MAGALDAQLGAFLSGDLQPLQSGAGHVAIAIPLAWVDTSPAAKASPKLMVAPSSPGLVNPLSSPDPMLPTPPDPPLPANPGAGELLPQAYSPASTGKINPMAAIPRRETPMGNLRTLFEENLGNLESIQRGSLPRSHCETPPRHTVLS